MQKNKLFLKFFLAFFYYCYSFIFSCLNLSTSGVTYEVGTQLYLFSDDYPVFAVGSFVILVATQCHLNLISIFGDVLMLCALPPQSMRQHSIPQLLLWVGERPMT